MAWDFTLSTGNKVSRSSRTKEASVPAPGTKVSRKVAGEAPTVIADPGNNPFEKMAGDMGSFFGQMSVKETQANLADEERKNNEALMEARRRVMENPEAARAAIESGDYTGFIDDDEIRGRQSVQDSFMKIVAANAAMGDKENLDTFINTLPSTANVEEEVQRYMAEKMDGASPLFADQYMISAASESQQTIAGFKKARFASVLENAQNQAEEAVKNLFQSEGNKAQKMDMDKIEGAVWKIAGSLPIPTPKKADFVNKQIAYGAMYAAARGNKQAAELIDTRRINPADPSSSTIRNYWKGKGQPFYKWQAAARQEKRETLKAHNEETLQYWIEAYQRQEVSFGETWNAYRFLRDEEGISSQNSQMKLLHSLVKGGIQDAQHGAKVSAILLDQLPIAALSGEDIKNLKKGYSAQLAAKNSLIEQNPQQRGKIQKNWSAIIDRGGMPDNEKAINARTLLDPNAEPTEIQRRMGEMINHQRMDGEVGNMFPDGQASYARALTTLYATDSNNFEKHRQTLAKLRADGKDIEGYYRNFSPPGKNSNYSSATFSKAILSKVGIGDDMSSLLRNELVRAGALGMALFNGDIDQAAQFAKQSLDNQEYYEHDGKGGVIRSVAPTGPNGRPASVPKAQMQQRIEAVGADAATSTGAGTTLSLGRGYERGGNIVTINMDGHGQRDMAYDTIGLTDQSTVVFNRKSDIPANMRDAKFTSTKESGKVMINLKEYLKPPTGKDSHYRRVGKSNYWWIWEENDATPGHGRWTGVYTDEDPQMKSVFKADPSANRARKLLDQRRAVMADMEKKAPLKRRGTSGAARRAADVNIATLDEQQGRTAQKPADPHMAKLAGIDKELAQIARLNPANKILKNLAQSYATRYGMTEVLRTFLNETEQSPVPQAENDPDAIMKKGSDLIKQSEHDQKLHERDTTNDIRGSFFEREGIKHIRDHEGYEPKKYRDAGTISIGYGFNLNDDNVTALIKTYKSPKTGKPYDIGMLKNGTDSIPQDIGDQMLKDVWKLKREQVVKVLGKDTFATLSEREQTAIVSMAYSALTTIYDDRKETRIIGALKRYAAAKKAGDTQGAAEAREDINWEIRYKTLPMKKMIQEGNAYAIDGLNDRRNAEADMFLGGFNVDDDGNDVFPARYNDWAAEPEFAKLLARHGRKNKRKGFDPRAVIAKGTTK